MGLSFRGLNQPLLLKRCSDRKKVGTVKESCKQGMAQNLLDKISIAHTKE